MSANAADVSRALRALRDAKKAIILQRFFKTGPGEYAQGDRFIGVMVPQQRAVAKRHAELSLPELLKLLRSPIHEERLTALFIMAAQYRRGDDAHRAKLYRLYLANTRCINNWDLVDASAAAIVGRHIAARPRATLRKLIRSRNLWERRIGVVATFHLILMGNAEETFWVAERLLDDEHDLIHKAVGWMLREAGKRVDERALRAFLDRYAPRMPRTMLRYAIERLSADVRRNYLNRPRASRRADTRARASVK